MSLIENTPPRPPNTFGLWLRATRKARGINLGTLARALHVSVPTLSSVELDLIPAVLDWPILAQQLDMSEHELAVVRQRFGVQDTVSPDAVAKARADEREQLARWHEEQNQKELERAERLKGKERERALGGAMAHRASATHCRRKTDE